MSELLVTNAAGYIGGQLCLERWQYAHPHGYA